MRIKIKTSVQAFIVQCLEFNLSKRDVGMAKHFSKKYGNKG